MNYNRQFGEKNKLLLFIIYCKPQQKKATAARPAVRTKQGQRVTLRTHASLVALGDVAFLLCVLISVRCSHWLV